MINQTDDFYLVEATAIKDGNYTKYWIETQKGLKLHKRRTQGLTAKEKLIVLRELVAKDNLVYPRDVYHYGIKLTPYKANQFVIDRRDY